MEVTKNLEQLELVVQKVAEQRTNAKTHFRGHPAARSSAVRGHKNMTYLANRKFIASREGGLQCEADIWCSF